MSPKVHAALVSHGHLWQHCGQAGLGSCRWALLLLADGRREEEGAVNPNLRSRSSWIRPRSAVRVGE